MSSRGKKVNEYVRRIKNGEYQYVEDLYRVMGNAVYLKALVHMKNTFDADDVAQDFWQNIDVYCEKMRFLSNGYSYLLTCMDNLCKMKLRKNATERKYLSEKDVTEMEEALCTDAELTERQRDLRHSFDRAAREMDGEQKLLFALLRFGGGSLREMAADLGWSKSKVARVKQAVIEIVKRVLTEDGWDKNDL